MIASPCRRKCVGTSNSRHGVLQQVLEGQPAQRICQAAGNGSQTRCDHRACTQEEPEHACHHPSPGALGHEGPSARPAGIGRTSASRRCRTRSVHAPPSASEVTSRRSVHSLCGFQFETAGKSCHNVLGRVCLRHHSVRGLGAGRSLARQVSDVTPLLVQRN